MNKKQFQRGSSHLILIIVLVIVILGGLGYVYWLNYMQPKVTSDTNAAVIVPADVALTEVASDQTTESGLAIKYPKSWASNNTSLTGSDNTTITSPDGKVVVNFDVELTNGLGGICAASSDGGKITRLAQLDTSAIGGFSGARFASYVNHNTVDGTYTYFSGAQVVNDANLAVEVGDMTDNCDSFGIGSDSIVITHKVLSNGYWLQPVVKVNLGLKDITSTSSIDNINNAMKTDDFAIAKRIVQSLYKKD